MADQGGKKVSRAQKKEAEQEENRLHWLEEERIIYDLWEKAYNPGGDAQNQRLARNRPGSSSGSSSTRGRRFSN